MSGRPSIARALRAGTLVPALLAAAFALAPAPPAAAEGMGGIIQGVTRPVILPPDGSPIDGRLNIARVLGPKLRIDRAKAAGRVAGLSLSANGGLLLAVLDDGSARLWDLARGAQIGRAIDGGTVAGAVGAGAVTVARRDGSMATWRPGGAVWPLPSAPARLDPASAVLSSDGGALAFRGADGAWRVMRGEETALLPRAAPGFRPVLSPDSAWAVWRTEGEATEAAALVRAQAPLPLGGCAAPTAGAFLPDGRVIVGDEGGAVCGWRLSPAGAAPLFDRFRAHAGPVRAVAADRGGELFATGGEGDGARVWRLAPRLSRVAEFDAADTAPGPLALDGARRWLFVGEEDGKVAILSWRQGARTRAGALVFTDDGWAVLDSAGRFDGSQGGVEALSWAGATEAGESRARPVDAFSENWFEPGLGAKLDDDAPRFLNPDPGDLPADGFDAPPSVSIDPPGSPDADGRIEIIARPEAGYPIGEVEEIRLYHNGKLTPAGRRADDGARRYRVRLLPGENRFAAVGTGPGGVEGPRAEAAAAGPPAPARRPTLRLVAAGIDDYSASLGPRQNLRYPRKDVEAVSAELRARAGALFDSVDSAVLIDSTASLTEIENAILGRSRTKSLSGDDVLVVYLSGHGYALPDGGGTEWYFMPWARDRGAPRVAEEAAREYGLSARALMGLLVRAEARRVFLVLDSCYSGAAAQGFALDGAARKALRRLARVGGIHVLAAASADETAIEYDLERHGLLTYLVLDGLRGAADENLDGTVSAKEIIAHADRGVPLLVHRIFSGALEQNAVGYSRGADFALAKL